MGLQQLSPMACQSTVGVFSALQKASKRLKITGPVLILNENELKKENEQKQTET